MSKSLLCTCEDVTLDDVRHAIDKGYRDIESIKRYTGFGTGVCQGKTCLSAVARVLAEHGAPPGAVLPFTPRPPLHPVEMSLLGSVPVEETTPPRGGVPPVVQVGSHALRPTDPALLHYRSGGFYCARAQQVPQSTPLRDVLLGLVAAADEPISGGRHKVFGNHGLAVIPQTSTIASHMPRAMGVAFAIERAEQRVDDTARQKIDGRLATELVAGAAFYQP